MCYIYIYIIPIAPFLEKHGGSQSEPHPEKNKKTRKQKIKKQWGGNSAKEVHKIKGTTQKNMKYQKTGTAKIRTGFW